MLHAQQRINFSRIGVVGSAGLRLCGKATCIFQALCYGALAFAVFCGVLLASLQRYLLPVWLIIELIPVLIGTATREGDAFAWLWPQSSWMNLPPFEWILIGIIAAFWVFPRIIRISQNEQTMINLVLIGSSILLGLSWSFSWLAVQVSVIIQIS